MIKRPIHVWLVFLMCVAGLIAAMLWLSYKTIQLDVLRERDRLETEIARQESELQERLSSALYRMDLLLLPLISEEAARPPSFYKSSPHRQPDQQPDLPGFGDDSQQIEFANANPVPAPEFVKLHFQIQSKNWLTSPQYPVSLGERIGLGDSKKPERYPETRELIDSVASFCSYDVLAKKLGASENEQMEFAVNDNAYEVPAINKIVEKIKQSKLDSFNLKSASSSWKPQGKVAIQRSRGEERVNSEFESRRNKTRDIAQLALNNRMQQSTEFGSSSNHEPASQAKESVRGRGGGMGMGVDEQADVFAADPATPQRIETGVMQPLWLDENLILARRVIDQSGTCFQCCWLDWQAVQDALRKEVTDVLPQVIFEPIKLDSDLNQGTALTTLPVQLLVDNAKVLPTLSLDSGRKLRDPSGLKMALVLAWLLLTIAVLASALMLNGVMKLSERRAAFVSAVTHELRTPLTTFRMYAEMLAEKMVPPGKEQDYASTLKVQADRLSHLVENVLQYARLEKSPSSNLESVRVNDLVDRIVPRLEERVGLADMRLKISIEDSVSSQTIDTQPANIEQVLFNLVDNACKYAKPSKTGLIDLDISRHGNRLRFAVRDYGPGVESKTKAKMFRPFHKSDLDAANSEPGVGLGLALCQRMAASLGGKLFYENADPGARFVLEL